jgi:hypothetical protein
MKVKEQDSSAVNFETKIYVPSKRLGIVFRGQKPEYYPNIEQCHFFYGIDNIKEYEAKGSLLKKIENFKN